MTKPSIPRLKDVAETAGISIGAASRILRGDTGRFGQETIERVLAAAKQLGWRRNLLVASIQSGRTKTVGVLVPPYDSFWINVLSGIHSGLAAADFLPITIWLGDLQQFPYFEKDDAAGIIQINRLLDRRVDALIMWPQIACAFRKCLSEVAERNVPVVVIELHDEDPLGDLVLTSEENSTRVVAEHLLNLGHRRIGCLSDREDHAHSWSKARSQHFQRAVQSFPEATFVAATRGHRSEDGVVAAHHLLTLENRPTAVFAVNDHLARDTYTAAEQLGLRVPEDLSVVGFSDLDFAAGLQPPLTTIHQRPEEMGRKAVELVLKRLKTKNQPIPSETIAIDGELVVRDSTAPPKR